MFIGHFAVGFAAKRAAPKASLGVLMAAPLFLDLLFAPLVLAGIERMRIVPGITVVMPIALDYMPWSHSLVTSIVWSLLFAAGVWAVTRDRAAAVVVGLGVFSHWILDFVTHRPDMPLYPGNPRVVGLGLWNSFAGTLIVEGALFAGSVWLYLATTRARNRTGSVALWALIGLLLVLYLGTMFGPPPPNVQAAIVAGLAAWLVLPWAWWIDRNRELRARSG